MKRGYSLVVEFHASDLAARVRFSLPAPPRAYFLIFVVSLCVTKVLKNGLFLKWRVTE